MSTRILRWLGICVICSAVLALVPAAVATTFQVVSTVNVAVNPFGIATRPGGAEIWVANSGKVAPLHVNPALFNGHTVTVINPTTLAITAVISVGLFPEDIAFTSDGNFAFVTNSTSDSVSVIDANAKTVLTTVDLSTIPMAFPFGMVIPPGNTELWVTSVGAQIDGSTLNVAVLNITSPAQAFIKTTLSIFGGIGRPALIPDGSRVLLGVAQGDRGNPVVDFVNVQSKAIETTLTVPPSSPHSGIPVQFAVRNTDGHAFLSEDDDSPNVRVIDLATRTFTAAVPTIDNHQFGIGITPDQRFVVVCNFLVTSVSIIDPVALQVIATIPVGNLPNAVAFTSDSKFIFVTNQGDTTVTVIQITG